MTDQAQIDQWADDAKCYGVDPEEFIELMLDRPEANPAEVAQALADLP
jgi:hypothetical protein